MHTYRFVFRRANSDRSFYCDFLAQNKAAARKQWTSFKRTEGRLTLLDIIKKD